MGSFFATIAPTLSWLALAAAVVAALYAWYATRMVRTLLTKQRELKEAHPPGPGGGRDYQAEPFYQFLAKLRAEGVKDPNVDLFLAVFENDTERLKRAIDAGANVNITDKELLQRYSPGAPA